MIRKATIQDAAIIAEVGKISFLESHGHSASSADIDTYVSLKYTADALTEELSDPNNIYFLIYANHQLAGYSKIISSTANENIQAPNVTCLDRLYLLRRFYGLNLGAQLLDYNIQFSKQSNQAGMWLHTWIDNKRAVAFYEKAGFNIVGKKDFRISEKHSNPNHVMYLQYAP